jgi:hypothetical protein
MLDEESPEGKADDVLRHQAEHARNGGSIRDGLIRLGSVSAAAAKSFC